MHVNVKGNLNFKNQTVGLKRHFVYVKKHNSQIRYLYNKMKISHSGGELWHKKEKKVHIKTF